VYADVVIVLERGLVDIGISPYRLSASGADAGPACRRRRSR